MHLACVKPNAREINEYLIANQIRGNIKSESNLWRIIIPSNYSEMYKAANAKFVAIKHICSRALINYQSRKVVHALSNNFLSHPGFLLNRNHVIIEFIDVSIKSNSCKHTLKTCRKQGLN